MSQGTKPVSKLSMVLVVVAALAIMYGGNLVLKSDIVQMLLGRWSFISAITNDHSTYYRLKVRLAYKSEPQDFDIVVACNVHEDAYEWGGRSYEAGLVPTVFGRRMSDGKGLVVRPPIACRGETSANGGVQPGLLPVIVVYENADRLDFGVAYLSEDAYQSPLSVLKFGGATIEKATRSDFDVFRRAQHNLITRDKYFAMAGAAVRKQMGLAEVFEPFAYSCGTYERYRIPRFTRELVQRAWPEDHPNYWVAEFAEDKKIGAAFRESKSVETDQSTEPHSFFDFGNPGDGAADLGFPTRAGGRVSRIRSVPTSYYPAMNDYSTARWPSDRHDWPQYIRDHADFADINIDFRGGATRGFAYCYEIVHGTPDGDSLKIEIAKRIVGRVDGERIVSKRPSYGPSIVPVWIFERDEYVWFFKRVYLGSPGGDV